MSETELIVINADIATMDPLTPRVTALAVVGGRISALGTDAEIRKLAASNTAHNTAHNLHRAVLDVAVPDHPCFILASDCHNATINSKACEILGVDRNIQDPPNGRFVKDSVLWQTSSPCGQGRNPPSASSLCR